MINFRVTDPVALIAILKSENVQVIGEIEEYEYGKFGWIPEPESNKVELWDPI